MTAVIWQHRLESADHNMIGDLRKELPMRGDMGGAGMITAMILMMLVMAGFSLAALARYLPAAWRARARQAITRPGTLAHRAGKEGAR
jgi:hypothetical protein